MNVDIAASFGSLPKTEVATDIESRTTHHFKGRHHVVEEITFRII